MRMRAGARGCVRGIHFLQFLIGEHSDGWQEDG